MSDIKALLLIRILHVKDLIAHYYVIAAHKRDFVVTYKTRRVVASDGTNLTDLLIDQFKLLNLKCLWTQVLRNKLPTFREVNRHIVVFIDEFSFQGVVEGRNLELLICVLLQVVAEVEGVCAQPGVRDGFADELEGC